MTRTSAVDHLDALQAGLLSQLTEARKALSLSQLELAERVGVNRMTIQRAEGEGGDPQLSTFLAMALSLNLMPRVTSLDSSHEAPLPEDLVHRGYAHNRTKHDLDGRDRQRERALSLSWEETNRSEAYGLRPIITTLIPTCTQEQASAAATVIQWLGSAVGFNFLEGAVEAAGYKITDISKK